eukprot:UN18653
MTKLIESMPLVQTEMQGLKKQALILKNELASINEKVNTVHHSNESITSLSEIDHVKKKIIHCSNILSEVKP